MTVYNLQTVVGATKTALQHQAGNPGDAAIADGYWSPGDGGGGEFYFESPASALFASAPTVSSTTIADVSAGDPVIVATTSDHSFQTDQCVLITGTGTPADGTWIVTRVSPTQFSLNGSYSETSSSAGHAYSTTITTQAAHGLVTGARVAIADVAPVNSALNAIWSLIGVPIGSTTMLTIGLQSFTYTGGGVIGDNGLYVPALASLGRWARIVKSPIDVRWYGAKGDGSTDDLAVAINACDAALGSTPGQIIVSCNGGNIASVVKLSTGHECFLDVGLYTHSLGGRLTDGGFSNTPWQLGNGSRLRGAGWGTILRESTGLLQAPITGVVMASPWAINTLYSQGDVVVPDVANGFAYVAQSSGTSINPPPEFAKTTTIGQMTKDGGGVIWKCALFSSGGFFAMVTCPNHKVYNGGRPNITISGVEGSIGTYLNRSFTGSQIYHATPDHPDPTYTDKYGLIVAINGSGTYSSTQNPIAYFQQMLYLIAPQGAVANSRGAGWDDIEICDLALRGAWDQGNGAWGAPSTVFTGGARRMRVHHVLVDGVGGLGILFGGSGLPGAPPWQASHPYAVGSVIVPSPTPNGYSYVARPTFRGQTSGTTGGTQPAFPKCLGSTTLPDGNIVWECYYYSSLNCAGGSSGVGLAVDCEASNCTFVRNAMQVLNVVNGTNIRFCGNSFSGTHPAFSTAPTMIDVEVNNDGDLSQALRIESNTFDIRRPNLSGEANISAIAIHGGTQGTTYNMHGWAIVANNLIIGAEPSTLDKGGAGTAGLAVGIGLFNCRGVQVARNTIVGCGQAAIVCGLSADSCLIEGNFCMRNGIQMQGVTNCIVCNNTLWESTGFNSPAPGIIESPSGIQCTGNLYVGNKFFPNYSSNIQLSTQGAAKAWGNHFQGTTKNHVDLGIVADMAVGRAFSFKKKFLASGERYQIQYSDGMFLSFDASAGNAIVVLPDANYRVTGGAVVVPVNPAFVIKRGDTSANTLGIVTTSGQTVDGAALTPLLPHGVLRVISNATSVSGGNPSGGNWETW
jgi:hypothetical protein